MTDIRNTVYALSPKFTQSGLTLTIGEKYLFVYKDDIMQAKFALTTATIIHIQLTAFLYGWVSHSVAVLRDTMK
jgi:hypothetical protein